MRRDDEDDDSEKKTKGTPRKVTVNPTPKDEGLFLFLESLFLDVRDERISGPDRIELRAARGPQGSRLGPVVREYAYRPREKLDKEQCVELCNSLLALAQQDANVLRRRTTYAILAYDHARSDKAIGRYLIAAAPTGVSTQLDDEAWTDEDEGGAPSTKLLLQLLGEQRKQSNYTLEQMLNIVSGALERSDERLERVEAMIDGAWNKQREFMQATEQMLSMAAKREIDASWAQWKQKHMGLVAESAIGLLSNAAAMKMAGVVQVQQHADNPVATFLRGLNDEQIAAAFGAIDEGGRAAGGVFSDAQLQLLKKIAGSSEIADADVSALRGTIRSEQVMAAQQIFGAEQLMPLIQWLQSRQSPPNGTQAHG